MRKPFIGIDGIPGSGKTTFRDRLIAKLGEASCKVHHVGQHSWLSPWATEAISEARRGAIGIDKQHLVDALIEDKKLHLASNVWPYIEEAVVIADRFCISDLLLIAAVCPGAEPLYVERVVSLDLLPDVNIVLEVSRETALQRIVEGRKTGRFLDDPASLSAGVATIASTALENLGTRVERISSAGIPPLFREVERIVHSVLKHYH